VRIASCVCMCVLLQDLVVVVYRYRIIPNVVASHRFATVVLKPLLSVSESGVDVFGS
jgi:hypothetical protein